MTIKTLDQSDLEPKEDLAPYAGQWVALRNGLVVASDINPMRLREKREVKENDVLLPVASTEARYLVV